MTDILSKAAKRNLNIQKPLQHNKFRAAAGRNIRPDSSPAFTQSPFTQIYSHILISLICLYTPVLMYLNFPHRLVWWTLKNQYFNPIKRAQACTWRHHWITQNNHAAGKGTSRKQITMTLTGLAVIGLIAGCGLGWCLDICKEKCACHPISA